MSLLDMYTKNVGGSKTIATVAAIGTAAAKGVNFFDGDARGPWRTGYSPADDVWQKGFVPNSGPINPAAKNDSSYEDSKWTKAGTELAFDGKGPATRPKGYYLDTRFTEFKDSAGRNGTVANGFAPTKLHKYAPITGKKFADVNTIASDRIKAGATSTFVSGING